MAATAPPMSAKGLVTRVDAAPVFWGAPALLVELPVALEVTEGVREPERVALVTVPLLLLLMEAEAEAAVARVLAALVTEADEADLAEAEDADEAEAEDADEAEAEAEAEADEADAEAEEPPVSVMWPT